MRALDLFGASGDVILDGLAARVARMLLDHAPRQIRHVGCMRTVAEAVREAIAVEERTHSWLEVTESLLDFDALSALQNMCRDLPFLAIILLK